MVLPSPLRQLGSFMQGMPFGGHKPATKGRFDMKLEKIVAQHEADLIQAEAAIKDLGIAVDYTDCDSTDRIDGYWIGRRFSLRETLTYLHGKELKEES
jgi:hypothetical protein